MRFLSRSEVRPWFEGKRVAIVGSGPGVLTNKAGFIDSHDVVVRVNNYRLFPQTGLRTDVFYSFFGRSITKTKEQLRADGVKLCMGKCPNSMPIESAWHRQHKRMDGIDFRWIYQWRAPWFFCDTYVPTTEEFLVTFDLLNKHIPTTGFSAILDVLACDPAHVYLTGFDFFNSRLHNVNVPWRPKNQNDPIRHVPDKEREWLIKNIARLPISCDKKLARLMR